MLTNELFLWNSLDCHDSNQVNYYNVLIKLSILNDVVESYLTTVNE